MDQGILQPYSIQAPQIRSAEVYLKATFLLIVSQECNAILQYPPLIQNPALGSLLFARGGVKLHNRGRNCIILSFAEFLFYEFFHSAFLGIRNSVHLSEVTLFWLE